MARDGQVKEVDPWTGAELALQDDLYSGDLGGSVSLNLNAAEARLLLIPATR